MHPALAPTPCCGVKTTRGVVSRIGPSAIHVGISVHPLARWCLAASRLGRPSPDGPHRSGRERPPAPRAWCGIAASVHSHPRPCLPGSLRTNNPMREGERRAGTGASRSWSAMPDKPVGQLAGQHVLRRLEAALDTLPGRIAGTLATPRGRGQGCASTPGPEPVPGSRTGGSLASRPVPPARHGPAWPLGRKTLPRQRINGEGRCASPDGQSAHRPPMSFARFSTAPTRIQPDSSELHLLSGASAVFRPHSVGCQTGSQDETWLRGSDDGWQAGKAFTAGRPFGRTIHDNHYGVGGDRVSTGRSSRCRAREIISTGIGALEVNQRRERRSMAIRWPITSMPPLPCGCSPTPPMSRRASRNIGRISRHRRTEAGNREAAGAHGPAEFGEPAHQREPGLGIGPARGGRQRPRADRCRERGHHALAASAKPVRRSRGSSGSTRHIGLFDVLARPRDPGFDFPRLPAPEKPRQVACSVEQSSESSGAGARRARWRVSSAPSAPRGLDAANSSDPTGCRARRPSPARTQVQPAPDPLPCARP